MDRGRRLPHLPALDGLRMVALGAVLLDHAGFTWATGGYLGVTMFFTLSGFLITSLLLVEHDRSGRIDLLAFWGRRARRLVPALLVFVGVVIAYAALVPERRAGGLLGDAVGSLTWVANWRFIAEDVAYADLFSDPSPFQHVWSLAVEEQFYLVFPVLAFGVLALRGAAKRWVFAAVLLAIVVASTAAAAALSQPGDAPVRAYYGTDARLAELAVGGLLALALVGRDGIRRLPPGLRHAVDVAALAGLAGLAALVATLAETDTALYEGGFLLAAVCTAAVVAASTQPGGAVAWMLGRAPLPSLGRVTYGGYLFHWPVYIWLGGFPGVSAVEVLAYGTAITFTIAALSYVLVERPVRAGVLPPRVGLVGWANASVALVAVLAVVLSIVPAGPVSELAAAGPLGGAPAPVPPVPTAPQPGAPPPRAPGPAAPAPGPAAPAQPRPAAPAQPAALAEEATAPNPLAPDSGTQEPASPAPNPGVSPDAARIAIVGDSMADNLGDGLARWAAGRTDVLVYNLSIIGCPISRGGDRRMPNGTVFEYREECRWWEDPATERSRNFATFDPDVVLVHDGINELPDRKLSEWPEYRKPGDPFFDSWLLDEYRAAFDVFGAQGAQVLLANTPCADVSRIRGWSEMDDFDERLAAVNRLYLALETAGRTVADFFGRICPGGRYSDTVEEVPDARPDGFHLVPEARRRLAERWLGPLLLEKALAARQQPGPPTPLDP